jgi:hypothetical protein
MAVRARRVAAGLRPVVKQIDTLAAEFPANTNYLYMTYHGDEDDVPAKEGSVVVLGGAWVLLRLEPLIELSPLVQGVLVPCISVGRSTCQKEDQMEAMGAEEAISF